MVLKIGYVTLSSDGPMPDAGCRLLGPQLDASSDLRRGPFTGILVQVPAVGGVAGSDLNGRWSRSSHDLRLLDNGSGLGVGHLLLLLHRRLGVLDNGLGLLHLLDLLRLLDMVDFLDLLYLLDVLDLDRSRPGVLNNGLGLLDMLDLLHFLDLLNLLDLDWGWWCGHKGLLQLHGRGSGNGHGNRSRSRD